MWDARGRVWSRFSQTQIEARWKELGELEQWLIQICWASASHADEQDQNQSEPGVQSILFSLTLIYPTMGLNPKGKSAILYFQLSLSAITVCRRYPTIISLIDLSVDQLFSLLDVSKWLKNKLKTENLHIWGAWESYLPPPQCHIWSDAVKTILYGWICSAEWRWAQVRAARVLWLKSEQTSGECINTFCSVGGSGTRKSRPRSHDTWVLFSVCSSSSSLLVSMILILWAL